MKKYILLFITVSLVLLSCTHAPTPQTVTGFFFDTVISVTIYDNVSSEVTDGILPFLESYENLLSPTISGSDVYRINHNGTMPTIVSTDTINILSLALSYQAESKGHFALTIRPLSLLWDEKILDPESLEKIPPTEAEIKAMLPCVSDDTILISKDSVTLTSSNAAIDLGAIAKGYIADRLKDYLMEYGVTHAIINLGGNVCLIGNKAGEAFRVGIQKPFSDNELEGIVAISDCGLVTSGTYERCYTDPNGNFYHHLLDAKTGKPMENELSSVTIYGPECATADLLSTICFLLGTNDGIALLETIPDYEGYFIQNDGSSIKTNGFPPISH